MFCLGGKQSPLENEDCSSNTENDETKASLSNQACTQNKEETGK